MCEGANKEFVTEEFFCPSLCKSAADEVFNLLESDGKVDGKKRTSGAVLRPLLLRYEMSERLLFDLWKKVNPRGERMSRHQFAVLLALMTLVQKGQSPQNVSINDLVDCPSLEPPEKKTGVLNADRRFT